jgi:hypothetical protein
MSRQESLEKVDATNQMNGFNPPEWDFKQREGRYLFPALEWALLTLPVVTHRPDN